MRISKGLLTAVALMGAASLVTAATAQTSRSRGSAPRPVPIEEWSQAKVVAMGREIYRQDTAAWRATDALVAAISPDEVARVRGWVVEPAGEDLRVRFVKAAGEDVVAGWDIVVAGGRAGAVTPAADPQLSDSERAQLNARQTAAANPGALRCAAKVNAVAIKDPDSDGWLVWLLMATTDANIIPMGGHYRFRISADGKTVLHRDQLTNSCLNMPRQQDPDGQPAAMVVSQIVSAGPVETHVFLSLQNRLVIYVSAGDKLYAVEGARIRDASAALRQ